MYTCAAFWCPGVEISKCFLFTPWQENFRSITKGQLLPGLFQGSFSPGKVSQASSAGITTLAMVVMAFARNHLKWWGPHCGIWTPPRTLCLWQSKSKQHFVHPIWGSEVQLCKWHHMRTPPAVTMSWWLTCVLMHPRQWSQLPSLPLSACKAWKSPGDRFLSGSPFYKSSLLCENTDIPNVAFKTTKTFG